MRGQQQSCLDLDGPPAPLHRDLPTERRADAYQLGLEAAATRDQASAEASQPTWR